MPQEKIYKNWKAVTEADFVSLFIKTWFAYISTLRTMFPEAANRRGDGKYLNAYKDYYRTSGSKKLIVDDQIMASMEQVYREGRKVIMEQYPEYYLWDFYHVNEDFEYTFKDMRIIMEMFNFSAISQGFLNRQQNMSKRIRLRVSRTIFHGYYAK